MTHQHDGELVVFLIGMTINKPWRVDLWWPTFRAMPRMLRELSEAEDSGLLGYRLMLEGRNPTLVQYWDSLDRLYTYATAREAEHWPAWRAFNRRAARASDAVGIWHETYVAGQTETVYVNTPKLGLAKCTDLTTLRRTEPLSQPASAAEAPAHAGTDGDAEPGEVGAAAGTGSAPAAEIDGGADATTKTAANAGTGLGEATKPDTAKTET
ncbi:DUF4188 domain-containing protein [Actinophytocola sp. KF-1]